MNKDLLKKVFEQSFLVVFMSTALYFVFLEYKETYENLISKLENNEKLLINRVDVLNQENKDLYERLIDCSK